MPTCNIAQTRAPTRLEITRHRTGCNRLCFGAPAPGLLCSSINSTAPKRNSGIFDIGTNSDDEFDEKWIAHRAGRESQVLTEMESSKVFDYSQTYDRVKQLMPLPFDGGTLILLALSIVIPALPAIFAEIPVTVALRMLLRAIALG